MTNGCVTKSVATPNDLKKIHNYTRREVTAEELYVFDVTLCNNDIDRDFERFSVEALNEMAPMFIGKTGIFDHSMKTSDQKARIFETRVEKENGKKTLDNMDFYSLKARAYMLNNEENKSLIDEIDAGIKKRGFGFVQYVKVGMFRLLCRHKETQMRAYSRQNVR